jgi:hypothetical protein
LLAKHAEDRSVELVVSRYGDDDKAKDAVTKGTNKLSRLLSISPRLLSPAGHDGGRGSARSSWRADLIKRGASQKLR